MKLEKQKNEINETKGEEGQKTEIEQEETQLTGTEFVGRDARATHSRYSLS